MKTSGAQLVLVLFLLMIPAGVFFFLTSPAIGFPNGTAGIFASVLTLIGFTLLPLAIREQTYRRGDREQYLPAKTGWAILLGVLVALILVAAYSALCKD